MNEDLGKEIVKDAKNVKKNYDKYFILVQKYLGEEGIYKAFRKRGSLIDIPSTFLGSLLYRN